MEEKLQLIYFDLVKKHKGYALIAKMCRAVNCKCPLAYVTLAGLPLSSKTHRKGDEHDGTLTPKDLRAIADLVEAWQKEVGYDSDSDILSGEEGERAA
ncbi:MAG TPA: hypothetical protein VN256_13050 [Pyrinomonadaceae bacterium]|nr:hypothetical protein [Pyrinomonadaceae bacterium]